VNIPVRLGEEPVRGWVVEVDPEAGEEQREHLNRWLNSSISSQS
jgi:hypothetical protein